MHVAALRGDSGAIGTMISCKLPMDSIDKDHQTAKDLALQCGHRRVLAVMELMAKELLQ